MYEGSTILSGASATKSRILASAGAVTVFHYAGHAMENVDDPAMARLVTAADEAAGDPGILLAKEIDERGFPGAPRRSRRLRTGAGRISSEGVLSLARPFMASGVPDVVVSLWPLEDRGALELSIRFHEGWLSGRDAAGALRDAQIHLIESADPELSSRRPGEPFSSSAWAPPKGFDGGTRHEVIHDGVLGTGGARRGGEPLHGASTRSEPGCPDGSGPRRCGQPRDARGHAEARAGARDEFTLRRWNPGRSHLHAVRRHDRGLVPRRLRFSILHKTQGCRLEFPSHLRQPDGNGHLPQTRSETDGPDITWVADLEAAAGGGVGHVYPPCLDPIPPGIVSARAIFDCGLRTASWRPIHFEYRYNFSRPDGGAVPGYVQQLARRSRSQWNCRPMNAGRH